jgi:hypothetical protein
VGLVEVQSEGAKKKKKKVNKRDEMLACILDAK